MNQKNDVQLYQRLVKRAFQLKSMSYRWDSGEGKLVYVKYANDEGERNK
jgi:hypothetical protein